MCFYCKLIFVTLSMNYATCDIMAVLHGRALEQKQCFINVEVSNNVEDSFEHGLCQM